MLRALWSGATGMAAQQFNIDNISNNLSNVNTSGYKKQRVQFQDLYYQNLTIGNSAVVFCRDVYKRQHLTLPLSGNISRSKSYGTISL